MRPGKHMKLGLGFELLILLSKEMSQASYYGLPVPNTKHSGVRTVSQNPQQPADSEPTIKFYGTP